MPIRIAYPFEGTSIGGGPISTLEIVQSLDPDMFEPLCVVHNSKGSLAPYLAGCGIKFHVLPLDIPQKIGDILRQPFSVIRAIRHVYNFIKDHKIDIVQSDDGPLRYIWFYAAKWAGIRFVLTQATLLRLTTEKRIAYRFIDAIIVNSHACRATLPPLPKRVLLDLCHPPIQIPSLPAHTSDTTQDDKIVIGFLANIYPQKRPETFIKMAALLEEKHPGRYHFVMAGGFTNEMENKISKLITQHNLNDRIELLGFCDDPLAVLSRFHVLVACSVDEAFGRNLVESMALGVPVVASDDGGHKEIIEHNKNGLLVPVDNPEAFADGVEIFNNPDTYKQISQAAKIRARKFYGQNPAPFFTRIYQTLIKREDLS